MEKEALLGKTLDEILEITERLGLPKFTATQLADWIYKKRVKEIGEMSNISKKARELLSAAYSIGYVGP